MPQPVSSPRDIQLDCFRGVALAIIFVNHIPFNELFYYTPSRFGFSDAAETFVFLSGFAAALAYGRCFESAGLSLGTLRIMLRCGQIYAAHLALFFLLAAVCAPGNHWAAETDYVHRLYIHPFFDRTGEALPALFRLRYVPNFFDTLPMYLVILLWVPAVWALSRLHRLLALGFPVLLYGLAWHFGWELGAEPFGNRPWYFNPFAWQILFFTGFALGAGWLRPPPPSLGLAGLCLLVLVLAVPLAHEGSYRRIALFGEWRAHLEPWLDKSHLGLLRWLHFLALAYLMNVLFRRKAHWLEGALARRIAEMGRHSLLMFLLSMSLSHLAGMVLDWTGREMVAIFAVNFAGLALLLQAARGLSWLHSQPWKAARSPAAALRPRPLLALFRLLLLAAAPLLLLQDGGHGGWGAATVTASLPDDDHYAPAGRAEEAVEWQDRV